MRTFVLICVFCLLATPAAAQSTTEDGIRAMLRGEYLAAARILRPLADDDARPDPVAQYFLAILYESGHGVTRDQARACRLFSNSVRDVHPFAEQSAALATFLRNQVGDALCVVNETWQGGPPQSFVLGPGHRIVFADTSISVTHGDREQRTMLVLPVAALYLPIKYTTLDVTRPIASRRHFFEWFAWVPDTSANPSWSLSWTLMEVVADQLFIPIASEKSLVVVKGETQMASYDVSKIVRLRVNGRGEAEFTIASETVTRTEMIGSRESR